jgi:hypothetical protein
MNSQKPRLGESSPMPRYFAHICSRGPVKYGDVPSAIGVLEALDKFMPIGEASCRTWNNRG